MTDNEERPPVGAKRPKRNARAGKPPAFQFYPADWLADKHVVAMTLEEEGAYIRLLCLSWREGSLPGELPALARLLKVTPERMADIWPAIKPCFRSDGKGGLLNARLERERRSQRDFSKLQSERRNAGIDNAKGHNQQAVDRNATGMRPDDDRIATETPPDATLHLHSASARSTNSVSELSYGDPSSAGGIGPPARPVSGPNPDQAPAPAVRRPPRPPRALTAAESRRSAAIIGKLEELIALEPQPGPAFRPGEWWGHGRKRDRDPEGMLETFVQYGKLVRDKKPPDDAWAYCEKTYKEKRANLGGARAERESEGRKRETTIFDSHG